MVRNMNFEPHLSALLFLATVVGVFAATLALAFFLARGRRARALGAAGLALACAGAHLGLALVMSARSQEQLLARGEEKYFCELDCHLAYAVTGVERVPSLGEGPDRVAARGEFYVVRIRCRFDEATTSPARPRQASLYPNPRVLWIEGRDGRRIRPSEEGARALAAEGRPGTPLDRPLRPGESCEHFAVFDVPRGLERPRLFLGEGELVDRLLVGSEATPFHRKAWFVL